ncbi:hypothetical protein SELMODRAFT_448310 [Selaginella moellendorffii]|uniref:FAS1 domain-containing protein n=2 Tax=Selaginella moellendorffii TaxID=88036 RepID=D8T6E5_SELML|nr:hypothetical protein SELMODRAFT_448310 [Selaginella moellendorffii]
MKIPLAMALLLAVAATAAAFNVTEELQKEPDYSEFNDLLTKSGLASDVNTRNSITVAVIPNSKIDQLRGSLGQTATEKQLIDIIRVHIFLTYINPAVKNEDQQITSLYQTTGKAPGQDGTANLTNTKAGLDIVMSGSNTTIVKSVKQIGYNLSIVEVDKPLTPNGVLPQAPTPAPPPGTVPAPAPVPVAPAPILAPAPGLAAATPASTRSPGSASDQSSAPRILASTLLLGSSIVGFALLWARSKPRSKRRVFNVVNPYSNSNLDNIALRIWRRSFWLEPHEGEIACCSSDLELSQTILSD